MLQAMGLNITRPTPYALAAMSDRVAPVVAEYSKKIGPDLVEQARAAMATSAKP